MSAAAQNYLDLISSHTIYEEITVRRVTFHQPSQAARCDQVLRNFEIQPQGLLCREVWIPLRNSLSSIETAELRLLL